MFDKYFIVGTFLLLLALNFFRDNDEIGHDIHPFLP